MDSEEICQGNLNIIEDPSLEDLNLERTLAALRKITEYPVVAFVCNCIAPRFLSVDGYKYPILITCGKCELCRLRTRREWSLRLALESFDYGFNSEFVTLTYNDENLPKNGSLNFRDYQLFLKRLRKISPPLRYFVAGEYGSKFGRPHYHMLVFGDYDPKKIEDSWNLGFVNVKHINTENINYCSAYVQKKLDVDLSVHEVNEFARMSTHPGIGYNWCVSHANLIMELGKINYLGRSYAIPRYFRKVLYKLYPNWCLARQHEYNDQMSEFFDLSDFPFPYYSKDKVVWMPSESQEELILRSVSESMQKCIDLKKKRELYKIKHNMLLEAL